MNKEEYVYQVFQRVAAGYDAANARISLGQHLRWKRAAARMLSASLPTGGQVLDLCCGTGDMGAVLLALRPDLRITGLDFSPAMLALAEERFRGNTRVTLLRGDAMALPFPAETFDGAVIAFGLRNTADCRRVLTELLRAVKPGAPVCVIDSFVPGPAAVRPFYRLYFSGLMPLLGGGLRRRKEYRWLARSTGDFMSTGALRALMTDCGADRTAERRFLFGACAALCGNKRG